MSFSAQGPFGVVTWPCTHMMENVHIGLWTRNYSNLSSTIMQRITITVVNWHLLVSACICVRGRACKCVTEFVLIMILNSMENDASVM